MPNINGAVMTAISETPAVKQFVLAALTMVAKDVLLEVDNTQGGSWNPRTQAKRYALANKILNIDLSNEDKESEDILSATARIVMIVINQEYFLFSSDPYQLQSDIVSNNIYNTIAKVTGMDLI